MSKVARKYWKPIIFALSLIIFIAISRLLLKNQISSFDDFIFSFISQFRCEPLTYFFRFVSFLCASIYSSADNNSSPSLYIFSRRVPFII